MFLSMLIYVVNGSKRRKALNFVLKVLESKIHVQQRKLNLVSTAIDSLKKHTKNFRNCVVFFIAASPGLR